MQSFAKRFGENIIKDQSSIRLVLGVEIILCAAIFLLASMNRISIVLLGLLLFLIMSVPLFEYGFKVYNRLRSASVALLLSYLLSLVVALMPMLAYWTMLLFSPLRLSLLVGIGCGFVIVSLVLAVLPLIPCCLGMAAASLSPKHKKV